MTRDEHRERHKVLHEHFDELIADYLGQNPGKLPTSTTMMELIQWSFRQTKMPTELDPRATVIPAEKLPAHRFPFRFPHLPLRAAEPHARGTGCHRAQRRARLARREGGAGRVRPHGRGDARAGSGRVSWTNALLAVCVIALFVDIWYTRRMMKISAQWLRELRAHIESQRR